nr:MAG TPA: hypothetical protein [Caudoviricetes sp.]
MSPLLTKRLTVFSLLRLLPNITKNKIRVLSGEG